MGWGYGTLADGKEVGYSVPATCEHPGCDEKIDRGLAYACGDGHGEDEYSCDGYFCPAHLRYCIITEQDKLLPVCVKCEAVWRDCYPELAAKMDAE